VGAPGETRGSQGRDAACSEDIFVMLFLLYFLSYFTISQSFLFCLSPVPDTLNVMADALNTAE